MIYSFIKIGEKSKNQTEVNIDGQEVFMLNKGEYVKVRQRHEFK